MRQRTDMDRAPQVNVFELPPIWGKRKTVIRWFGISARRLDEMMLEGYVRSVKFGGKSGQRLFRLEDVDDTLKRLAYGLSQGDPAGWANGGGDDALPPAVIRLRRLRNHPGFTELAGRDSAQGTPE